MAGDERTTESVQRTTSGADLKQPSLMLLGTALLFAVTMCASASIVFSILVNEFGVPAALCVSWRLAWVEIIQLLPFLWTMSSVRRQDTVKSLVYDWVNEGTALLISYDDKQNNNEETNSKNAQEPQSIQIPTEEEDTEPLLMPRVVASVPWMVLSGVCLGVHFSSWVFSLEKTSLTHSLLWVSMGPIVLNMASWLVFFLRFTKTAPSRTETTGALLGFSGAVVMLGDVGKSQEVGHAPTLFGDTAALVGAVAVCGYLMIGRALRSWMPLWIYSFFVVGSAYLTSLLLAVFFGELSDKSVFDFLRPPYIIWAFYLGAGPGVCGHTLLNGLLRFVSPLTVSTAMLSEPLIGSIMGFFFGLEAFPGLLTWTGGIILMVGLFLVIYGEHRSTVSTKDRTGRT